MVLAKKILERPFVGSTTRLLEKERKLTLRPSPLMDGVKLEPLAGGGSVPAAELARIVVGPQEVVIPAQVFLTKMFSTPFAVFTPRLDDSEAKATTGPMPFTSVLLMLGRSLVPLPGIVPFEVDTKAVEAVQVVSITAQVSRT